jgi:hypothetical protein
MYHWRDGILVKILQQKASFCCAILDRLELPDLKLMTPPQECMHALMSDIQSISLEERDHVAQQAASSDEFLIHVVE